MSRINCHSAFRHYEMFHGHGACGGGSYGSIFNTTYNIKCGGHGGFWGGFGAGLGCFVGNLFGGFMGNMGFGGFGFGGGMGFGFPGFGFGFPNFGGGSWFGGGNSSRVSNSHSSNTTTCNCKCCKDGDDKTNSKDNEDKDQAKLSDLIKKVNALKVDKTTGKTVDPNDVAKLRKELEELKETPLDDVNGTNNKDHYARLLDELNKNFPIDNTKDGTPVQSQAPVQPQAPAVAEEPVQGNEDTVTIDGKPVKLSNLTPEQVKALNDKGALTQDQLAKLTDDQKVLLNPAQYGDTVITPWSSITWNSAAVPSGFTTPSGYTDVNSEDAKNITAENLKRTHDTGKPVDVVNTHGAKISDAKYNGTNFPLYLQITDSKAHNYKCIGTDGAGRAYYTTPASDTNKNVYVLVKKGNEYVLYQDNRLSGQNKGDLQ